jgi:hypothetical protein
VVSVEGDGIDVKAEHKTAQELEIDVKQQLVPTGSDKHKGMCAIMIMYCTLFAVNTNTLILFCSSVKC